MDLRDVLDRQRQAFVKNPFPEAHERREHLHRLRKSLSRCAVKPRIDEPSKVRLSQLFNKNFLS